MVTRIAKVGDVKSVGRIGLKAIVYFELMTTFALVFGPMRQPGRAGCPGSTSPLRPSTPARSGAPGGLPRLGDGADLKPPCQRGRRSERGGSEVGTPG
ncbi:hypothetical protein [Kribbella sp. NBC_00359]|uniref:hypothetical protein n=1 Tax=Kribbella sp. NBC_00359 TaxID=2975966 RepID=UPI003FA6119C